VTSLGLGLERPKVDLQVGLRSGWLRHVGVAVGGASGAAVVLGAYELMRSQPEKSFQLLQVWGPAFLVALMALWIFGQLAESLIRAVRESFGALAQSVRDSADATMRQAEAQNKLAEIGGEQARETQRLAMFAAQESQNVYDRLDRQDEVLHGLAQNVAVIRKHLCGDAGSET
jgi:hypothetical protein